MDHPYQTAMQLPAAYAVITEEEMTYLDGGAIVTLGHAFGRDWNIDTDQLTTFCVNFAVNLSSYVMTAAYSYVTNIFATGIASGLSIAGCVWHAWGKLQTPWSRMGAVAITGIAGVYAGMQAYSIYTSLKNLYDSIFYPMPDFSGAYTTQTEAAAA